MVQDSWDVKGHIVKEVQEEQIRTSAGKKGKGKRKDEGHSRPPSNRMYIGRRIRLLPVEPASRDDDDLLDRSVASSSPASSRESSLTPIQTPPAEWPRPDIGESAHFGFEPSAMAGPGSESVGFTAAARFSLSPGKMTIALSAALGSLDVSDE